MRVAGGWGGGLVAGITMARLQAAAPEEILGRRQGQAGLWAHRTLLVRHGRELGRLSVLSANPGQEELEGTRSWMELTQPVGRVRPRGPRLSQRGRYPTALEDTVRSQYGNTGKNPRM